MGGGVLATHVRCQFPGRGKLMSAMRVVEDVVEHTKSKEDVLHYGDM